MSLGRLHYTNYQYITNTCDCVESLHYFGWFVVCFPIVVKALLYGFDPYIYRFPCNVTVPRSHVPVLLAMQWSVAWISAFYRGREHLWIVFSFNICQIYHNVYIDSHDMYNWMKVVRYRSLYILCVLCSHHEGKRVMYRITEYKPLLDSSNMMETDWMKIAFDLFVSTIAYHNYTYKLLFNVGEEILSGLKIFFFSINVTMQSTNIAHPLFLMAIVYECITGSLRPLRWVCGASWDGYNGVYCLCPLVYVRESR